uniref:Uncharacterized protein n=1 Tax=Athene cunicularia TaxID=194338 RepID=A0A663NCD2_ATHCN
CIALPTCEDCNIMIIICRKKIRKQFTLQPGLAQFCQRSLSTPGFSTLHLVSSGFYLLYTGLSSTLLNGFRVN